MRKINLHNCLPQVCSKNSSSHNFSWCRCATDCTMCLTSAAASLQQVCCRFAEHMCRKLIFFQEGYRINSLSSIIWVNIFTGKVNSYIIILTFNKIRLQERYTCTKIYNMLSLLFYVLLLSGLGIYCHSCQCYFTLFYHSEIKQTVNVFIYFMPAYYICILMICRMS